jgi:hypothetical protein
MYRVLSALVLPAQLLLPTVVDPGPGSAGEDDNAAD